MGFITLFRDPVNVLTVSGSHYLFRDPVTFLTVSGSHYLFRDSLSDPVTFLTVSNLSFGIQYFSYS